MEASALPAPRPALRAPLLRLRSDEQLLELFRAGHDEAFDVLHDRYRQRLFAYVRQMLSPGSRQDAEDVMQDVFVRAFAALRADGRDMNVRAWLYRVAHNRCIDQLRRPAPAPAEVFEVSRRPLHDPVEEAQRREDLARLVADIAQLPEHQRSALLMREIDGLSYHDLSAALDVTVPAVKSLLVRARMGLVEASEARDADCAEIRRDLVAAYDRGVKASGHARRHLRTCSSCTEYRHALRGVRRSFAALTPVGFGPLALVANLVGAGGGGAGAAAGASGGAAGAVAGGGAIATVTACKVAAVVCTAAITAGGAVEAKRLVHAHHHARAAAVHVAPAARPVQATGTAPIPSGPVRTARHAAPAAVAPAPAAQRAPAAVTHPRPAGKPTTAKHPSPSGTADDPVAEPTPVATPGDGTTATGENPATMGDPTSDGTTTPATGATGDGTTTAPQQQPAADDGSAETASAGPAPPPPAPTTPPAP